MQPRITQVPPSRYSSATMTFAPCSAAIRAARTPPDPPPITKRSTSLSAMSHIVSALLHLRAHFVDDLFGKFIRPFAGQIHAFVRRLWFFGDDLLAERRLVERQNLLQLRFGEMARVGAGCIVYKLTGAGAVLFDQVIGDFVQILAPHEVGLHEEVAGLDHHPANQRVKDVIGVFYAEYFLWKENRGLRRRGGVIWGRTFFSGPRGPARP